MSTPGNDQHGSGEEMISNTKECTSYEQNKNNVDNITEGINNVNVTATIDMCAACGKEGDDLKACAACFMVKYCNRDCQIAHRPQHKKECKKRAAEIYDEVLFKEVEPQECPICLLLLPSDASELGFQSCCGKLICNGCIYAMKMSEGGARLCPYCRTPPASSDEEKLKRTNNLMDRGIAYSYYMQAGNYARGRCGMPVDFERSNQLLLKAGELGCAVAYYNLGNSYMDGEGVEVNMKKAKHYWELAAMKGHVEARSNLGVAEAKAGNWQRSLKHFMIAAKAGSNQSMDNVQAGYKCGIVTKDEYEVILRAHQKSIDGMKSESRDKIAAMIRNARM